MPSVPISCSFVLDWSYLGINSTEYIAQRDFVSNVSAKLYESKVIAFGGNAGMYGNIDSDQCFFTIINCAYFSSIDKFNGDISRKIPSTDCPTDLCDALEDLNDFQTAPQPQQTCLVFFSGGTNDFNACRSPIDKKKYNSVIGAVLGADTKVSEISDSVVNISRNFDQNDVNTLVNQIVSTALERASLLSTTTPT